MKFEVSDIVIALTGDMEPSVTEAFEPFLTDGETDYCIGFREILKEDLPVIGKVDVLYHGDCFDILTGTFPRRSFFELSRPDQIYALGEYRWDEHQALIQYQPEGKTHLHEAGNAFFHIGLESLLLHENRMILHSCLVSTEYGGILFSGNSGVGKSTQGDLWCRYEKARILNGDRSILYQKQGQWYGAGSPYAGSSRYYVNESIPIRAIVMLRQDSHCSIRILKGMEAFRRVLAQLTVNSWDAAFTRKICELTELLLQDIVVYELACTPDQEAVALLAETLGQEDRL